MARKTEKAGVETTLRVVVDKLSLLWPHSMAGPGGDRGRGMGGYVVDLAGPMEQEVLLVGQMHKLRMPTEAELAGGLEAEPVDPVVLRRLREVAGVPEAAQEGGGAPEAAQEGAEAPSSGKKDLQARLKKAAAEAAAWAEQGGMEKIPDPKPVEKKEAS